MPECLSCVCVSAPPQWSSDISNVLGLGRVTRCSIAVLSIRCARLVSSISRALSLHSSSIVLSIAIERSFANLLDAKAQ